MLYGSGGFSDPPQQPEGSVAQKAVKKAAPSFFSKVQGLGVDLLSKLQQQGPLNSGPEESKAESKAAALSAPDAQGDGTAEQPGPSPSLLHGSPFRSQSTPQRMLCCLQSIFQCLFSTGWPDLYADLCKPTRYCWLTGHPCAIMHHTHSGSVHL